MSCKRAARLLILRIKGENCDETDFKMGVFASLPELSEWTVLVKSNEDHYCCPQMDPITFPFLALKSLIRIILPSFE